MIDFPIFPADGQQYSYEGRSWTYSSAKDVWDLVPVSTSDANLAATSAAQAVASIAVANASVIQAKDWASKAFGTVDGTSYSAKKYAADAAAYAAQAASIGGAPASRLVQRILSEADVAQRHNMYIHDAKELTNPPVVDSGALFDGLSGGLFTRSYPAADSGRMPWNLYGGEPVQDGWGLRMLCVTSDVSVIPHVRSPQTGGIEFMLDGDEVILQLEASYPFRFLVEEGGSLRAVDYSGLGSKLVMAGYPDATIAYYKLTFATRAHRRIMVEALVTPSGGFGGGRFGGAFVKDQDQIFAPKKSNIRWIVMGDSLNQGRNGPSADSLPHVAFKQLGAKDIWLACVGSTGAIASPNAQLGTYATRRSDWFDHDPDVLMLCLSWNDLPGNTITQIVNAMMIEVAAARTAFPELIIFVQGLMTSHDDVVSSGIDWNELNDRMGAAVVDYGDNYVRFINMMDNYEAPVTGLDVVDGGGNYHLYSDGHYLPAGDLHIGTAFSQMIHQALEEMYYGATAEEVVIAPTAITPASGTASFTVGDFKTVSLASVSSPSGLGAMTITPALPDGLTAGVSAGQFGLTGTATEAAASAVYLVEFDNTGSAGTTVSFTLTLQVLAEAGATPWTIADLANPTKVWYVADAIGNTKISSLTTNLADQASGGYSAMAVRGGAVMTDTLNGRPVLKTTTGGDGVFVSVNGGTAIGSNADIISIFAVQRTVDRNGAGYPSVAAIAFSHDNATMQTALLRGETGWTEGSVSIRTRPTAGEGGIEIGSNTDYGSGWLILGATRRYANDDGTIRVNGVQVATGAMSAGDVTSNGEMSLAIGNYSSVGTDIWSQNIAEIVVVRGALSVQDCERIEGYLADQWGLQANLPVGHPYKAGAPTK